jgi:hypothetical protein
MSKRTVIFVSILALAVISIFTFLIISKQASNLSPESTKQPVAEPLGYASPAAVELTESQRVTARGKNTSGPTVSLHNAFNTAQNYAAFIADALNRPAEGGRFYAYVAFNKCQEVMAFPKAGIKQENKNLPVKQQAAVDAIFSLQERCADVAKQFPDPLAFYKSVLDSRGEKDPTFSLYNRLTDSSKVTEDIHKKDLNRAIAGGDSYDIVTALELGKNTFTKDLANKYGQNLSENIIDSAFAAVGCEFSQTCTTNLWVLGPCATLGKCEVMNRSEQLRSNFSGKQLELFDSVKQDLFGMVKKSQPQRFGAPP